jgi:hypothetical protein
MEWVNTDDRGENEIINLRSEDQLEARGETEKRILRQMQLLRCLILEKTRIIMCGFVF